MLIIKYKEGKDMNFRNNKGYTGVDISVAMIIILIFIPTIFAVVNNIQRINAKAERQANAVNIATDILEIAKSLNYDGVETVISETDPDSKKAFTNLLSTKYGTPQYETIASDVEEENYDYVYYSYSGEKNVHYRIQIGLWKYKPEETQASPDLVKKIKVTVTYPVDKNTKTLDISTVVQKNS